MEGRIKRLSNFPLHKMQASVLRTETMIYPEYQLDITSSIVNSKSNGVTRGGTQDASVQEQPQETKKAISP
jgi:hypothetical protein